MDKRIYLPFCTLAVWFAISDIAASADSPNATVAAPAAQAKTVVVKRWPGPQGDTYASIAKLPDWSGTWIIKPEFSGKIVDFLKPTNPDDPESPRWTAVAAAANKAADAAHTTADGTIRLLDNASIECLPHGMPLMMALPAPVGYEFLFTPGRVTLLSEEGETRRIYTDGRADSEDPEPTFTGESIGHWDAGTLVIDTIGIKSKASLVLLSAVHPDARTHVTERMYLKGKSTLVIETTVEDPGSLIAPWHYHLEFERSNVAFIEYVCQENNREKGGVLNLTPPQ